MKPRYLLMHAQSVLLLVAPNGLQGGARRNALNALRDPVQRAWDRAELRHLIGA